MDCFVTLDAGTGSGRCMAFDADGRVLAAARAPFVYPTFPVPDLPVVRGVDLDAPALWAVLAEAARDVMARLPSDAVVRGVVPTSQREACLFLDAAGDVLYAGPNLDGRAVLEGLEVEQAVGADRLHAVTGHVPPYIFPIARWRWFVKHGDASKVATMFMLHDWMIYRLSGARIAEHSSASESMLYDVGARAWSAELAGAVDMHADVLPPLVDAGSAAGTVHERAAAETGIPAGTPVWVGGPDTECALVGSGVARRSDAGVVLGTTAPVQVVTETPILDPAGTLWTSPHVIPDRWVLESNCGDTGGAYRWLVEVLFGAADDDAYARAEALAGKVGPEPRAALAHLGPVIFNLREMNPSSTAGVLFGFPLVDGDRPSRADILRAFLESVAFAVRGNAEQIVAVSGTPLGRIRLSGGLSQMAALPGLIATALGRPVERSTTPDSASLGCALIAAVAAGCYDTIDDATEAMVRTTEIEPDPTQFDAFTDHFERWRAKVRELIHTPI